MGRETMDEDDETEVNARRTSSPPAPYDEPPPAQLDDSFVATFRQCKPPNPTPIRGKWIPNYEFGDLSKGLAKRAKGGVLNYTGKSDFMFGDNKASTDELEWWEGCKTSCLRVPFVELD